MPSNRKKRIRTRVVKTGESWQTAARHDEIEQDLGLKCLAEKMASLTMMGMEITQEKSIEKLLKMHAKLGRSIRPLYKDTSTYFGWVETDNGQPIVGYMTSTPGQPDRPNYAYKFWSACFSEEDKLDEDDHEDFLVMYDAIVAHVAATGDTIMSFDDPLNGRLGLCAVKSDDPDRILQRHWRIHTRKLGVSLSYHPNQERADVFRTAIKTRAGRLTLAASIPGQKRLVNTFYGEPPPTEWKLDDTPLPSDWNNLHDLVQDMEAFSKEHPEHTFITADDPGHHYQPARIPRMGWVAFLDNADEEQAKTWTIPLRDMRTSLIGRSVSPFLESLQLAQGRREIVKLFDAYRNGEIPSPSGLVGYGTSPVTEAFKTPEGAQTLIDQIKKRRYGVT